MGHCGGAHRLQDEVETTHIQRAQQGLRDGQEAIGVEQPAERATQALVSQRCDGEWSGFFSSGAYSSACMPTAERPHSGWCSRLQMA